MKSLLPARGAVRAALVVALAAAGWGAASAGQATGQAADVVRIGIDQFEQLLREGDVVLVDVRDRDAYVDAHLPDAVSIPLDQLERSLARLRAANARIVLYCGGPAGVKSGRAAILLRDHGFERVYCLDGGFERWVASGRVVVVQPTEV